MNDMPNPSKMLEATRLTRAGRLTEATALIRRMLRGETAPGTTFGNADDIAPGGRRPPMIDAKAATIPETDRPLLDAATSAQPHMIHALRALLDLSPRTARVIVESGGPELALQLEGTGYAAYGVEDSGIATA